MTDAKVSNEPAADPEPIDVEKSLLANNEENLDFRLTKDNKCGFLCFHQTCLQKMASKKSYVVVHGFAGAIMSSIYAYFNGIVTTMEKRFKIPTRNIGLIVTGFEIGALITGPILTHYLKQGHRPKWVSFAIFTAAIYCFLLSALHLMYGPGKDALDLTIEYGAVPNPNSTNEEDLRSLCQLNATSQTKCEVENAAIFPQVYLFSIHLFSGIFGFLYDSLGTSYMDDNVQKAKAPMLLSLSYFLRLLGPSIGYGLASMSLAHYIAPQLTPTITQTDSRWMGAWWLGSLVNGLLLTIISFCLAFFPKELPRAAIRRQISQLSEQSANVNGDYTENEKKLELSSTSNPNIKDALMQLVKNKVIVLNVISGVFLFLGLIPFWMYAPKYIETQYRQTAAQSSFLTGSVAIIFTALGTLTAGFTIQKVKPTARQLTAWNIFVGLCTTTTIFLYAFIGCPANDNAVLVNDLAGNYTNPLSPNCHCEYVKFSPICGEDGNTYVSPCHAGCIDQFQLHNGTTIYDNCFEINSMGLELGSGKARSGFCPVNCDRALLYFMIILCINQFISATAQSTKLLITMRAVDAQSKAFALAFGFALTSLLALMPAPIIYGWIFDQTCVFWGKTCTGTGNCWLYDLEKMRKYVNFTAAGAMFIATLWEANLFRIIKHVKLFDQEEENLNDKLKDLKYTVTSNKRSKTIEMKNIRDTNEET